VRNRFESGGKVWYDVNISMTSYKIHSIKNSEKLSFIIEWESEKTVSQKLSGEGHIILSVEKVDTDLWKSILFWRKEIRRGIYRWKNISRWYIFRLRNAHRRIPI
jgi:hypothetical protein